MLRIIFFVLATALYSQIVNAQSRSEEALTYYEEGLARYRARDYDQATHYLEKSLNIKSNVDAHYLNGLNYQALEKNLRAVAAFEAALLLDPDYLEARFQKAIIYLQYGDPEQAVKDFTYLIDYQGNANTRSILFQIDMQGGAQNKLVTLTGMKTSFYHYRGKALLKLNRRGEAMADFNEALLREKSEDVYISRALLWVALDEKDSAISDLKKALSLNPKSDLAWYNLTLLEPNATVPIELLDQDGFGPTLALLAAKAVEKEDYILALQYFDKSLEVNESDELVLINRARVLTKVNQFAKAREDLKVAYNLDMTRTECLYLIGNTYFFEKKFSSALSYYDQLLAIDYSSGMVWYNAAMCHLELDNEVEACHYLSQAARYGMARAKGFENRFCEN